MSSDRLRADGGQQPGRIQQLALFITAYIIRVNKGKTFPERFDYVFNTFGTLLLGLFVTGLVGRTPESVVRYMDLGGNDA